MKNKVFILLFTLLIVFNLTGCSQEQNLTEEEMKVIQEADQTIKDIAKIMGVEIKRDVKKGFKSRDELVNILEEMMNKEYPDNKLQNQEQLLKFIGFIPADMDLKQKMTAFYLEQVGGFYDPESKELYLIRHGQIPLMDNPIIRKTMMAHELTHAIQDMYLDLEKLIDTSVDNDLDIVAAIQAAIEGQATIMMFQYTFKMDPTKIPQLSSMRTMLDGGGLGGMSGFTEFTSAPKYLQERLALFPYLDGAEFYLNYIKHFPEKKPASLFDNMPVSSEQILHFNKYIEKDLPQQISLKDADGLLGKDWIILEKGAFGEIDWRLFFSEVGASATAQRDAEGWDGSSFYFYENTKNKSYSMVMISTWDTEKDLNEAKDGLRELLIKKYPKATIKSDSDIFELTDSSTETYLLFRGMDLILLERIPAGVYDSMKNKIDKYTKTDIKSDK